MTLYVDMILIENIIMNYIILLTTAIVCKNSISHFRMIVASIIGAIYAVLMYIFELSIYNNLILKTLLSICMVYVTFNSKNIKILLKQITVFYLTSFCFGGATYYLLNFINSKLVKNINENFMGIYPIKMAILGGTIGFIIINISFKIVKNRITKKDLIYDINIYCDQKKVKINALLDTGNMLNDPITGIPVLIAEKQRVKDIVSNKVIENLDNDLNYNVFENIDENSKRRYSIIPFSSVGKKNGILIGFRPDYIEIHIDDEKIIKRKAIIGIYNGKISKNEMYSGLIGLNLLNQSIGVGDKQNEYNSNIKI